ncbi:MAG: 50S ribosomal protein L9 [Gammaproteobacteria bacterium]|nr:50S ribosomal protein L9 [Gammaproteobacteria bacterium]
MNVILLERIGNLGDLGDEVNVKSGFARNFLIPKGKAVRATDDNRSLFEGRRTELERHANEQIAQAQARATKLEGLALIIMVKAGEEGKLYGSVGTQDIVDAAAQLDSEFVKSEVRLPDGVIRVTGEYEIDVQLHSDVTVPIQVSVVSE